MSGSTEVPKYYEIQTFPVRSSVPEPFVNNIKSFLEEFCQNGSYQSEGVESSFTLLVNTRGVIIPLFVFQEDVETSTKPACLPCLLTGWGSHFLSRKRFHFIITATDMWDKPTQVGVLECQTHVLHGVIHSNGYSHLLAVKSIDGGSSHINIIDLMQLWNRICISLHAREISVTDACTKMGMDMRLLDTIAHGKRWFSQFGYLIQNEEQAFQYHQSVAILQNVQLNSDDMEKCRETIKRYQGSQQSLQQLFSHMLHLLETLPKSGGEAECPDFLEVVKNSCEEKDRNRVLNTALKLVRHMKKGKRVEEEGGSLFTSKEIHNIFRSKGIIGLVLANVGDTKLDGVIVRRKRIGHAFSYYIEDPTLKENLISYKHNQVVTDLKDIYDHVSTLNEVKEAWMTVLQSHWLIRTYSFQDYKIGDTFNFDCGYKEEEEEAEEEEEGVMVMDFKVSVLSFSKIHVVLPRNKTAGEIKRIIEDTWNKVYFCTRNLKVSKIDGFEGDDSQVYMLDMGQDDLITVIGPGFGDMAIPSHMMFEGGCFDCSACSKDNLVGKLLQCHQCHKFGHQKCYGFGDEEIIPLFLCRYCLPRA